MGKRVIIGFGTGRCGTKSLAEFLNQQQYVECKHEEVVPFDPQWGNYMDCLTYLLKSDYPYVGNISVAWLNYVDRLIIDIPDLRLICLDRGNPKAVVDSFHSYCKNADFRRSGKDLYGVFPVLEKEYSRWAIQRTVDRYLWLQEILLAEYPILHILTSQLNEEPIQELILDHCGIPDEYRVYGMKTLNKRGDMGKGKING